MKKFFGIVLVIFVSLSCAATNKNVKKTYFPSETILTSGECPFGCLCERIMIFDNGKLISSKMKLIYCEILPEDEQPAPNKAKPDCSWLYPIVRYITSAVLFHPPESYIKKSNLSLRF